MLNCSTDDVPRRQRFFCDVNNPIVSIMCSFDGGPQEPCSFPVVAGIERFGTDSHTLAVTVEDVFGQGADFLFDFTLFERKTFSSKNTIRASVDALCRDGTSEISRDPRTKRLQTRRESLARPSKHTNNNF